ncbi:MAG: hypothetical protein ACKVT0_16150 [Planctomycetaceae bacterium]
MSQVPDHPAANLDRSRRCFLTTASLGVSSLLLAGANDAAVAENDGTASQNNDAVRKPLRFLMPDDFEDFDFIAWRVNPGEPDPHNPLLEPEMPWESGGVFAHGTVLIDPIDKVWKAWQVSHPAVEQEKFNSRWHQARLTYLESPDGVKWIRPKLREVNWPGYDETNIIMDIWTTYASVHIDPRQSEFPYEMFAFRNPSYLGEPTAIADLPLPAGADRHPPGMYRFRSQDGKSWKAVAGPLKLNTSDSCYFYRFGDGKYTCYHKTQLPAFPGGLTPFDVADGGVRIIGRRTSDDGLQWSDPTQIVMTPDWRDPADTQFMELCPIEVPGGYVATLTVYHNMTQTIDLQWAASRDGIEWWRPERRPALANAPLGEYGGGMIWPMRQPVQDGNKLHVYYCGTEGLHGDLYNTKYSGPRVLSARGENLSRQSFTYGGDAGALCRATWTADRLWALASAHGGYTEGTALTRNAPIAGKQLTVNAVTKPGGKLRVELLSASKDVLPGFSADECEAVEGDHHAHAVRWKGGTTAPAYAARVRYYLKRAFLYGLEWN